MRLWSRLAMGLLVGAVACGGGSSGGGTGGSSGGGGQTGGGSGGGGQTGGGSGGGGQTGGGSGGGGQTGGGSGGSGGGGSGGGGQTGGGSGGGGTGGSGGGTPSIAFPTVANWTFYGPQHGGPRDLYDATMDEGGNIWVAGGTEGLFLLKPGATQFVKFGIADGLHPYGWVNGQVAQAMGVPDGSPADLHPDLNNTPVISVAGGPAGTVFVGYQGKPNCESAWQGSQWTPPAQWGDPSVYKSGDADRVTLNADGKTITVNHYDIFSGPNVIRPEPEGREKLCTVYRIKWDKAQDKVWFGGNHGVAIGKASAPQNPTCDGEYTGSQYHPDCTNVWEHTHPAINACAVNSNPDGSCNGHGLVLTDGYFGIGLAPDGDAWLGGYDRSTVFHFGTYKAKGQDELTAFYNAQADTEDQPPRAPGVCTANNPRGAGIPCGVEARLDFWKDPQGEWNSTTNQMNYPGPNYRDSDDITGIEVIASDKAWVSSSSHGLALVDSSGNLLADESAKLPFKNASGLVMDDDGSLWVALEWDGGVARYNPSTDTATSDSAQHFGNLANQGVGNVQKGNFNGRSILVPFHAGGSNAPGFLAVYTGP